MTALDEQRIARMRTAVMDTVDADVRRRGRRARVVRTGAAVCAVAIVAGLGAHVITGHGDSPSPTASSAGFVPGAASRDGLSTQTQSIAGAAPAPPAAGGSTSGGSASGGSAAGQDIVATGSAHVVTPTPLTTAETFISWVQSSHGYVAGQSDTGTGSTARMTLTVRVPDQEAAIARLRALGKVDQVETNADDVTSQATDLDARIKEARISIARLEAILSRTTSVSDVLTAETALTNRQQQLESMILQRKKLSDQVSLATLTVSFTAEAPAPVVGHQPGWFHRNATRSLHALGDSTKAVVDVIVYVAPWLVVAGLVWLLWIAVTRLIARRRGQ